MDILLSQDGQPIINNAADLELIDEINELIQNIRCEAITQEGDLFYDEDFGWSLLDFKNAEINELDILEIEQRIKLKLKKYSEIDQDLIAVNVINSEINLKNILKLDVKFKVNDINIELDINVDRIKSEVIIDE